MDLFQSGAFDLHGGGVSDFKIECDALSDDEMNALAFQLAQRLPPYRYNVFGIPRGGLRVARAMEAFAGPEGPRLVCDDVLTTGLSFRQYVRSIGEPLGDWIGAVLFARGFVPEGITALFHLHLGGVTV